MKQSENVGQVSAALTKAQSQMKNVSKNAAGYGYKYAKLEDILDAILPVLTANDLSLVQAVGGSNGSISVHTQLTHKSGEYFASFVEVPVDTSNKKMNYYQACGSGWTYLKKYAAAAIVGLAIVDDSELDADAHPREQAVKAMVHKENDEWAKAKLLETIAMAHSEGKLDKEIIDKAVAFYKHEHLIDLNIVQLKNLAAKIKEDKLD